MIRACYLAIRDILTPELRAALIKSVVASIVLFVVMWFAVEWALGYVSQATWPWVGKLIQAFAGLGMIAGFVFLMAPVTAAFAGIFQDGIVAHLEKQHYPLDQAGKSISLLPSIWFSLTFTLLALVIDLSLLPLVFFAGFGVAIIFLANAYLISRQYFELTAARYMPLSTAKDLRREHATQVLIAGAIPAGLSIVPFLNVITPIFATSYFLHLVKDLKATLVHKGKIQ